MRPRPLAVLCLAPFLLQAQSPSLPLDTLLKQLPGPKVLLLGPSPFKDQRAWLQLLEADPLVGLEFQIRVVPPKETDPTLLKELKGRYNLEGRHWAILDARDRCLASGTALPEAAELAESLAKGGLRSRARLLRDFLKVHPDHLEAREQLISELHRVALRRATRGFERSEDGLVRHLNATASWFSGPSPKTPPSGTEASPTQPLGPLGSEEDLLLWAPLAQELETAFRLGQWRWMTLPLTFEVHPAPEARSPLLKALAQRHLAKVEGALQTDPISPGLWQTWTFLARCAEDRPWKPFLQSLAPFRYAGGPPCPTPEACTWLTGLALRAKDWESLATLGAIARRYHGEPKNVTETWTPGGAWSSTAELHLSPGARWRVALAPSLGRRKNNSRPWAAWCSRKATRNGQPSVGATPKPCSRPERQGRPMPP